MVVNTLWLLLSFSIHFQKYVLTVTIGKGRFLGSILDVLLFPVRADFNLLK